jgi:hypothetical protein
MTSAYLNALHEEGTRDDLLREVARLHAEVERLTRERDFARDAVVQKCRQYDADMETMRLALDREMRK